VLMVVSIHLSQILGNGNPTSQYLSPYSKDVLDFGSRGVQVFFVLSAIALCRSYSKKVSKRKTSYFIRRFFRIYPVWFIAVIIHAILEDKVQNIPQNLTFAFGWLRQYSNNPEIVGGSWTLFVELIFYLAFPFVYPLVRHRKLLVILTGVMVLTRILWLEFAEEIFAVEDTNSFIGLFPLSNLYCFLLGLLIHSLVEDKFLFRSSTTINIFIFILLLATIVTNQNPIFQVLLLSFLIYSYLSEPSQAPGIIPSKIRSLIESFGKYAFTIYLYHLLVLAKASKFLNGITQDLPYIEIRLFIATPITFISIYLIGKFGYYTVEETSIGAGKRLMKYFFTPNGK